MGSPDELKYKEFSQMVQSQQQVQLEKCLPLTEVENQAKNQIQ